MYKHHKPHLIKVSEYSRTLRDSIEFCFNSVSDRRDVFLGENMMKITPHHIHEMYETHVCAGRPRGVQQSGITVRVQMMLRK